LDRTRVLQSGALWAEYTGGERKDARQGLPNATRDWKVKKKRKWQSKRVAIRGKSIGFWGKNWGGNNPKRK